MSTLQELLLVLESASQDADRLAAQLAQQAQRLVQAAAQTVAVTRQTSRTDGGQAAAALQSAQRATSHASQLLHHAAVRGRAFVAYHSGAADGASAASGAVVGRSTEGGAERSVRSALANFWSSHSGEYIPPGDNDWDAVPATLAVFSPPTAIASWINDGGSGQPGRGVNCADCARAVELSWRGHPQVSAARAHGLGGESFAQIEEWLGAPLTTASFGSIGSDLSTRGPGASAYIVVTWLGGGGHAFNAVNYEGTVYFIDAQPTGGAVDFWPPKATSPGYGFDETQVEDVYVSYRP